ncbi:cation:proton antiporter [Altericroceibacterium xinjiangense]|uniref:cation:proton antiporter domain-containing protein n=1 Tax=Altericroceibacterium xinjiangense TaxID=762261 RepID=UPI000F7F06FF|nr:cation:proton antiporter [Altericroceibacterium xinjiangense]
MHEAGDVSLLRDGFILLGFALGFVLVFRRIGLGATLGYLVAGVAVGPHGFGFIGDAEGKLGFAELGITLLLFVVGLELNPARLWRMKRDIFGLGLIQVTVCGLALAAFIWTTAGFTLAAALALGLPLALSSTAQVLPMLQSSGRLRTPFGERAFSVLLFQDLSLIPLITILAVLSRNPADAGGPPGWQLAIYTVLAIAGIFAAGRFLLTPLLQLIGRLGEREMFVVAALFTIVASAALMEFLGLSTALGAFVAGVVLADSPYRHELETDVEPFRSILLGLFFLAVGMMLDLGAIAERPLFVLSMAAGLIAVKTGVILALGLLFGMNWRGALALGLLLSQGGEFGFVLFAQAEHALLISREASSLFGAVVTLSMALTPLLMIVTRRFRKPPPGPEQTREEPVSDGASAVVVGYGRFGQTVAQILLTSNLSITLIDRDIEMIDVAGSFGAKVYYGDGTRLDVLRQAGAGDAQLILFCLDGDQLTAEFLHAVREAFPKAAVFARTFDRKSLIELRNAPVEGIFREVFESAIGMARLALNAVGVNQEQIDRAEGKYRTRDSERLDMQFETGSLRTAQDRILTQPETNEAP